MKSIRYFLSALVLFLPLTAHSAIENTVYTAPASTENLWEYSRITGLSGLGTSFVPNISSFSGVPSIGYVSGTELFTSTPEFDNFRNLSHDEPGSLHLFSTYIVSSTTQTVDILYNGDDGHSLWVDGVQQGGGGFGVWVLVTLNMIEDVPMHIEYVGANSSTPGGGWGFTIGYTLDDTNYYSPLENISGVSMDAEGFTMAVEIDIKPGSDPNCFNVDGHGVIPVAILGSDEFNVSYIDQGTLSFAGLEVRVRGNKGPLCGFENTNNDGYIDMVCHFEDDPINWSPGSSNDATLTGMLLDGSEFEGVDSICVVP